MLQHLLAQSYLNLKRAKNVEELLACLYLQGISIDDFHKALFFLALLGEKDVLSLLVPISRLKQQWFEDYRQMLPA
ncbi:MAG: hypothetical protein ACTS73_05830 [Arsenophonus sp. NEOnobi-MAG3]